MTVEPDHEEIDDANRTNWLGVAAATLVAAGLIAVISWTSTSGGGIGAAGPTTTLTPPTAESTSVATSAVTTESMPPQPASGSSVFVGDPVPLGTLLPQASGTLHAVVGDGQEHLARWATADLGDLSQQETALVPGSFGYSLDAGGDLFAHMGNEAAEPSSFRLLVSRETSAVSVGVSSYAWHATEPGMLAATRIQSDGGADLSVRTYGRFLDHEPNGERITDVSPDHRVLAWGPFGFVLWRYDALLDERVVTLLDRTGSVIWQRSSGPFVRVSNDGAMLLSRPDAASGRIFELIEPEDPASGARLDVPSNSISGASWSPDAEQLALHFFEGPGAFEWVLQIYDRQGRVVLRDPVPWRVWELSWSADGRFILMPGADEQGTSVIVVYDTLTNTLTPIEFASWVHWAVLR